MFRGMSKNFPGIICAPCCNLHSSFLNITRKNPGFSWVSPVFPLIMETSPCALCIKTSRYKIVTSGKMRILLHVYSFLPRYLVMFSGFLPGVMYNHWTSMHQRPLKKPRKLPFFPLFPIYVTRFFPLHRQRRERTFPCFACSCNRAGKDFSKFLGRRPCLGANSPG